MKKYSTAVLSFSLSLSFFLSPSLPPLSLTHSLLYSSHLLTIPPSISLLQVLVPKDATLLGKMFEVVITSTGKHYLKGEVLTDSLASAPPRPSPLPHGAVSGTKEWEEKEKEKKKKTETLVAAVSEPIARKEQQTSTVSWAFNWLRGTDLLLIFLAALILCTAVLSHYTQLFSSVWSW